MALFVLIFVVKWMRMAEICASNSCKNYRRKSEGVLRGDDTCVTVSTAVLAWALSDAEKKEDDSLFEFE